MSNVRRSHLIGKRAIAAVLSASMVSAGVTVVNVTTAPAAFAQENTKKDWRPEIPGAGSVSVAKTAVAGGQLKVTGKDLNAGQVYTLKLDDFNLNFTDTQTNDKVSFVNGTLEITANDQGEFTEDITLPADLPLGEHNIRLLGGLSKFDTFTVVEAGENDSEVKAGSLAVDEVKMWSGRTLNRAETFVSFTTEAFEPGTTLKVQIDGVDAEFNGRRGGPTKEVKDKSFSDAVKITAPVTVGKKHTLTLIDANDETKTAEAEFTLPAPYVALADQKDTDLPNSAIGSTVNLEVQNLPEGAELTFVGVDDANFLSSSVAAGADNTVKVEGVKIPDNTALVGKFVEVKATIDGELQSFTTPLKVTISNAPLNVDQYNIKQADLKSGLYQVVKSDKAGALFVTQAQRTSESELLKVDPETLEVIARVEAAPVDPANKEVINAVYGVGVDDELGLVWTTNTRSGAVTVFDANDLSVKKTFPAETLGHPRDVIVDPKTHKAYVTDVSATNGAVQVFDGNTLTAEGRLPGIPDMNGAVGATFDPNTGDLFTVPFDAPWQLVRVNVRDGSSKAWDLEGVDRTTGVTYDPKTGEAYIANQYASSLTVFDTNTGKIKDNITVGAGTVYTEYDEVSDRVYVTNRTSGTLTVIDPNTHKIVANIPVGEHPNDVRADGKGGVYVVNKSSQVTDAAVDQIFHIVPKELPKKPVNPGMSSTPGSSDNGGSSNSGSSNSGSSNSGSSNSGSSASGLMPILGALFGFGLLAAIIGGILHFMKTNPIPGLPPLPAPAPAPAPQPELPAKDGHPVANPVHR